LSPVISVLFSFVKEQKGLYPVLYQLPFIVSLTEATFMNPVDDRLVFERGVDLIGRIVEAVENPEDTSRPEPAHAEALANYLRAYSLRFAARFVCARRIGRVERSMKTRRSF
jgi:hypothetical protein